MDLLIKESELNKLDEIIGTVPTKFGLPLVNFFNQVAALRQQEANTAPTLAVAQTTDSEAH